MKKQILVFTLLLITCRTFLYSQAGSTGLSFLKLGVGARALSMGEAYTAIASDPSATHYNPAALSLMNNSQILLMHKEWIQDTKTEFLAATTSFDKFNAGISINGTTISDIELRTTPGPAQGTFTARNAAIGISASYALDTALSVGATMKYLYEKILVDEANGLGFDIGAIYRTPWDIRLGAAVCNLGSMNELRNESSKLPQMVRFGAAYESRIESFDGTFTGSIDVVTLSGESLTHVLFGGELNYHNTFALRAGYQTSYESKNFTAGIGIHYGLIGLNYAFVPFKYDFGTTHTFSLGIEIP